MGGYFAAFCAAVTSSGGGGGTPVPEFDGPAGIAAAALLVSIAAVLYEKHKK